MSFTTPACGDDMATLTAVTVRFSLPKGDNKDDNTSLYCTIQKDDVLIANLDNFANGEEFNDPGDYGPYKVEVKTAVTKAFYRGSATKLRIQPHGGREHDTVIMNTIIEARFSDGTTMTSESGIHRYVNASSKSFDNR